MFAFKLAFFALFSIFALSSCTTKTADISEPFDELLKNYDSRFRPFFGKHAVSVRVSTYITKIFDYSDADNMAKINFYFRQSWVDPRLAFENTSIPSYITTINFGSELAKKIWIPDTFASSAHKLSYVSKDEGNTFLLIYRNGTVFLSRRLTAKIACQGSKAYFPFDRKTCHFHVESYSMKVQEVLYSWVDDKPLLVHENHIPFQVYPGKYYSQHMTLLTGTYSIIGYRLDIERFSFHYILSIYLPLILTTLLAGTALNAKRDWSSSTATILSGLFFVGELVTSILIKLSLNDKLSGTFTALDLFLLINFLFMFFYQFMHLSSIDFKDSRPASSDTKIILDESAYSDKNHQFGGFFKTGLTLTYSLFVVSYLFVCVTMRYLSNP